MPTEEVIRLKEELDSLRMKCEEINKALCCQLEKNKELTAIVENGEAINAELRGRVKFLEGQVDAYQYCLNCRR